MSKLIDKLCEMTRITPQPMGFRTARSAAAKPRLLLVTCLPEPEAIDRLAEVTSGADAVLLTTVNSSTRNLRKINEALSVPWGLSLPDIGKKGLELIVEAGCDFLVFPPGTRVLAVPKDDDDECKVGRILQVASTFDENLLRVINELAIDAVYIADEPEAESFLTWQHVMLLQRFGLMVAKPILVRAPDSLGEDGLQLLWEVGMDGVVVECGPGLAALRESLDKLTLPARKRRRAEALVPFVKEEAVEPELEEEEEEE